jgi:hypothetical protein
MRRHCLATVPTIGKEAESGLVRLGYVRVNA